MPAAADSLLHTVMVADQSDGEKGGAAGLVARSTALFAIRMVAALRGSDARIVPFANAGSTLALAGRGAAAEAHLERNASPRLAHPARWREQP